MARCGPGESILMARSAMARIRNAPVRCKSVRSLLGLPRSQAISTLSRSRQMARSGRGVITPTVNSGRAPPTYSRPILHPFKSGPLPRGPALAAAAIIRWRSVRTARCGFGVTISMARSATGRLPMRPHPSRSAPRRHGAPSQEAITPALRPAPMAHSGRGAEMQKASSAMAH